MTAGSNPIRPLRAGEKANTPRSLPLCLLLFFLTGGWVWALDAGRHISQYGHTAWRIQDGFIKGAGAAVTQTTDGYLWLGTEAGLLRFDGVRFVPWTPPAGKELLSSNITGLLAAKDGSLWIGTEVGLSHWANQDLINYASQHARINSIIEDRNGTVWFTRSRILDAAGALCQVIGTGMRCYGRADGIPDSPYGPLVEDTLGNLWMGSDTEIVRWKPGSSSVYKPRGLRPNVDGVQALALNADGSLWAGMALSGPGLGLQRFVQGVWKPFTTPELDGSTLEVSSLLSDRARALWIGTLNRGIYRISSGRVDHFAPADGLSGNLVSKFYEDREGNLWVVTTKGIDCFRDLSVTSYSTREGLTTEEVDAVYASRDGTVWIGGDGALDALRLGSVSAIQAGKGLPGHQVAALFEDHTGKLWVGIDDTLSIYENGRFSRIDRRDGSPIGLVVGITEDVASNIWVETTGSPRTLFRIRDHKVQEELPAPLVPAARRVAADPEGGIWLGLLNGDLARYRHGQMESFHFKHARESRVEQLVVNPDGSVLGATTFGLIALKSGRQQILTVRNGLPCDSVFTFIPDSRGALWLYMPCGLVEIPSTELKEWLEHPDITVQLRVFDVFDGVQPGWAPFNGAARTADGRLWFANGTSLQVIDPAHLPGNAIPPPVHVEGVVADRKSYAPRENLRLPPLTRDLELDYTALSFVVPQRVRFRYKLEGHDQTWQEPGTRRQAFYSDLRPGNYRFRVIACNNDGVWNETGASLDLSITPAWYQTTLFRVSCASAFILCLWALYQLRLRQLERQFNMGLEARVDERSRIARELHDTLLQSFHGLLLRFQAVSNLLPAGEAKQRLDGAIEHAAEAITEGRDAVHELRASTAVTSDLAEAIGALGEELASDKGSQNAPVFQVHVEGTARGVDPMLRDEVYRIVAEGLRNAFRHAEARRIEVEVHYDERELRLRLRDDGRGMDARVLDGERHSGHWGLRGMRERAKLIGGSLEVWSELDSGSEVELRIPASVAYSASPARRWWVLGGKGTG